MWKKVLINLTLTSLTLYCAGCTTAPSEYEERIDSLTKELRQAQRERDAAREDYEYDIVRALRRDDLERRYPYTGLALPKPGKEKSFNEQLVEALDTFDAQANQGEHGE